MSENDQDKVSSDAGREDPVVLDPKMAENKSTDEIVKDDDKSAKSGAEGAAVVKVSAKKRKKTVSHVLLKVTATFNNTKITVTDASGNTLAWASAGQHFKGSRKRTPFAAETAAQSLIDKLRALGVSTIDAVLKGAGPGRDAAVKPFGAAGFHVLVVRDATPVPHNGCRPPKVRRT
jgi:small subunit ribosomal protein S11